MEDEFHVVIACSKSRALRHVIREEWGLPHEKEFRFTCRDWLQVLLDSVPQVMRDRILLLLWRCWHLRDDCVHGDGKETISNSIQFLQRYEEEWRNASLNVLSEAGKTGGTLASPHPRPPATRQFNWVAPAQGWAKVNSDAAFSQHTGCC